ncbi:DUF397 domain-containing protein [Microbispora rosea]|uniref:DUF397 domain-containing protein n=1 Tax=Microbispora rosea TaxID=58117 RepID=UPI00344A2861
MRYSSSEAQPDLRWLTTSRCTSGNCVQIAFLPEGVALRDSKNPGQGMLVYSTREWREFIAASKAGDYDLPR